MADTSAGFRFRYRLCGLPPTILDLLCADTETLTKGDFVTLATGELDLAATNDAALLGIVLETASGTDSTTRFNVIVDADAVYSAYDANARLVGATLDVSGATGAMALASTSNADFTVVAESSATQETFFVVTHGEHAFN